MSGSAQQAPLNAVPVRYLPAQEHISVMPTKVIGIAMETAHDGPHALPIDGEVERSLQAQPWSIQEIAAQVRLVEEGPIHPKAPCRNQTAALCRAASVPESHQCGLLGCPPRLDQFTHRRVRPHGPPGAKPRSVGRRSLAH